MEKSEIKVCKHCVMNTTDTNLVLDENGVCDRCHDYEERVLPWWNHGKGHEEELKNLIADIKLIIINSIADSFTISRIKNYHKLICVTKLIRTNEVVNSLILSVNNSLSIIKNYRTD